MHDRIDSYRLSITVTHVCFLLSLFPFAYVHVLFLQVRLRKKEKEERRFNNTFFSPSSLFVFICSLPIGKIEGGVRKEKEGGKKKK